FLVKPVTKSTIVDTLVTVFVSDSAEAATAADGDQAVPLRGARILLAEDNEINQQIAIDLLEDAGATVTVANNGRKAVTLLSNGPQPAPFDVVLMDLQMPEMDGHQATATLRSDARFATLPIVAMTAHATIEERQRCLAIGMNEHISKPIDPGNLIETVARFHKPRQATSLPATTELKRTEVCAPHPANDLKSVAGLDTKDGLARVAGKWALYLRLLRQFIEEQSPAPEQITTALSRSDTALAERLAHTLKGVAGSIGARQVQSAAGTLEKLIRARATPRDLDSAKSQVAAALDPLIAQLKDVLPPPAPETREQAVTLAPLDQAQSREAAVKLLRLLSDSDPGATDFIEANPAVLQSLFADEEWSKFEKLVRDYSFAAAQSRLEQAMENLPAS
ncbi:MAG TPA: response regulator, partial [Verrucomicrobiae bacterium]|nr:response regulator [Verrucomicrobiae bacterium]